MYNESYSDRDPFGSTLISDKEVESPTMKKSAQIKVEASSPKREEIKKQAEQVKKQKKVEKVQPLAEQMRKYQEM